MLRAEYESKQSTFDRARFRATYDMPYIQAEFARFESVVNNLTSDDPEDIICRCEGFLFSSFTNYADGPYKETIFKYDALNDACLRISQHLIDLGKYKTIAVKNSLVAF